MIRLQSPLEMKQWRKQNAEKSIGFVPTMGALHEGHLSLIAKSKMECDLTVVSIFVNPLQFNNSQDLKDYPRPMEKDLSLIPEVDLVWTPQEPDLYPNGRDILISESNFSKQLCGAHRPGHFDGVLTVVMKLFQVVHPSKAYFGEKDFQQLTLIQKMVDYFFLDTKVVPCPTLREPSGLAMSSRNLLLNQAEREKAPALFKTLTTANSPGNAHKRLSDLGFKVEYVEDIGARRFAAAWLGKVRLIDNVEI